MTALLVVTSAFLSSCHRTKSTNTKRYPFTGRVISIDSQSKTAVIDGDAIPDYMDPMAMTYKIKPDEVLSQLAPGDSISAEVVVVHTQHVPAPGEDVPDLQLTNQSGKRISLKDCRGKTLLVTFIYTRCPFTDFCPRVSATFAEVYKQIAAG